MILFDYVFYTIALFYSKFPSHSYMKEFAGALFLSLFQTLNIFSLKRLIIPFNGGDKFDSLYTFFTIPLLLVIFNMIRYYKYIDYMELSRKWGKENKSIKIFFVICYFTISMIFFLKSF